MLKLKIEFPDGSVTEASSPSYSIRLGTGSGRQSRILGFVSSPYFTRIVDAAFCQGASSGLWYVRVYDEATLDGAEIEPYTDHVLTPGAVVVLGDVRIKVEVPVFEELETRYVFVYGTLMRGYGNNPLLADTGCEFIGEADTCESYVMVASGCPTIHRLEAVDEETKEALGLTEASAVPIRGEVWKLSGFGALSGLDGLEGYDGPESDSNVYVREVIEVRVGDETVKAFTYFGGEYFGISIFGEELVPSGDYRDHRDTHLLSAYRDLLGER